MEALKAQATAGDAGAQFALGSAYEEGRGVPADDRQAAWWYRQAAQQGHADAQCSLGVLYASGRGVVQDDKEAVKWYRLAAEQGQKVHDTHSFCFVYGHIKFLFTCLYKSGLV